MSNTKHYVDMDNNNLGCFGDSSVPAVECKETPIPIDGRQKWDGEKFNDTEDIIKQRGEPKRLGRLLSQVEDPDNEVSKLAIKKLLKHILKEEATDA